MPFHYNRRIRRMDTNRMEYVSFVSLSSSVVYCARFSRHQRVHVHSKRNFPQAKLDREINVPFLLNEHDDLYFLLHDNSVHIIFFNLKKKIKKKSSDRKKDIGESVL